jgi:predicted acyltransferase
MKDQQNNWLKLLFLRNIFELSMAKGSGRVVSLDIFRGLTIVFMIIAATPGSRQYIYSPFQRSEWRGCTPADLVFPFFLFLAGISAYFSLRKYGDGLNGGSAFRIFRRMLTLFAAGLFLSVFPDFGKDFSTVRIMGVLQRIAIASGIGALICLTVRREYLWIVIAVLLLIYWGLLAFFGGPDPYSLATNFVRKADIILLGKNHMYKGFGIPFDPEGLVSTIPAICTVIIGYFTGGMIGKGSANMKTVFKLILIGSAAAGLGFLWNYLFPFNGYLWTSSYVLFSSGIAMALFALIHIFTDVLKVRKWGNFFLVFGTNSLFSYFLIVVWTRIMFIIRIPSGERKTSLYLWIYEKICVPVLGNMNGSLMFAVIQMLLIWGILLILYRKKIMIRL